MIRVTELIQNRLGRFDDSYWLNGDASYGSAKIETSNTAVVATLLSYAISSSWGIGDHWVLVYVYRPEFTVTAQVQPIDDGTQAVRQQWISVDVLAKGLAKRQGPLGCKLVSRL
jgi:hypothetical protein